jgi:penicillin-binding protein 2
MALNSAIGQGDVTVTPLQLAVTYAAIGNGGVVYQPQVVSRVESPDGRVDEFQPVVVRNVNIPPEHTQLVLAGLTAVVNEPGGTAYRSRLKGIIYAGKTGTAQVVRLGSGRTKEGQVDYWSQHHAWFAAFAPAQDPEIAVVVLNEHGGHGGNAAAPAAAAVIQKYFDLKNVDLVVQKAHRSLPEPGPPPIPATPSAPPPAAKNTRPAQSYAQGVPPAP